MAHQGRAAFDLHHGVECRPSSWCIAVADKPTEGAPCGSWSLVPV